MKKERVTFDSGYRGKTRGAKARPTSSSKRILLGLALTSSLTLGWMGTGMLSSKGGSTTDSLVPQAAAAASQNPSPLLQGAPGPGSPAIVSTPCDSLPDLVERISPGVINLSSTTIYNYQVFGMDEFLRLWGIPQERKQTSLGSGFIIDTEGFAITNNHVVERASEVLVTLHDKRQFKARIVGKDPRMDLALLQLQLPDGKVPPHLKPVPLGNSETVRIGETAVAVGNPFGLQHTVTKGIISAKNRTIGLGPFDNFLQTDASINPGNSGGPLFNLKGEVIGINSVIHSKTGQSAGVGFAIPVNEAKQILPDLKRYGRVPRPWLGILSEKLTPPLQAYYDLPVSQGVILYDLVEDGPAELAGLRQGDILIEVDQVKTLEPNDVERVLAKHKPTDRLAVKFYRGNKRREITLQLAELPRLSGLPGGMI